MHHLVIGEGQIGRAIIDRALTDGESVTVLRRSEVPAEPGIRRVTGDLLDPARLEEAAAGADAIHACFHAPYDARVWKDYLPPRELAVLDVAAAREVPVIFPESMYGFVGGASDLAEGAPLSPQDAKGEVRALLLAQRRVHEARTLSLVAADLWGPGTVGTGAAVVTAMLLERIAADARPMVVGDPAAPHSLTYVPDLAVAMLHAARQAVHLAPDSDAVLHAPSAPARSQAELISATVSFLGARPRRPLVVPRLAVRVLAPVSTLARELSGIAGLWYRPCRLRPGALTDDEGLEPTSWQDALEATARAAVQAKA